MLKDQSPQKSGLDIHLASVSFPPSSPARSEGGKPTLDQKKQAIVNDFGIKALGDGQIEFNLNGKSVLEFVTLVHELAGELGYTNRVVHDMYLKAWSKTNPTECEKRFAAQGVHMDPIRIEAGSPNSWDMTRLEQEKAGFNNVPIELLVAGYAAYLLVANGKSLFPETDIVRAQGGAVIANPYEGIHIKNFLNEDFDERRHKYITGCKYL